MRETAKRPVVLMLRLIWNHECVPLNLHGFKDTYIDPEPEYPSGRKGLVIARQWKQLSEDAVGLVLLDGDVVIDPYDNAVMGDAVTAEPAAVHVAPVKIWPRSTKYDGWRWGHGVDGYTQQGVEIINTFTFNFTYLPRELVDICILNGMEEWTYPHVDRNVVKLAQAIPTPVRLVQGIEAKHVNF